MHFEHEGNFDMIFVSEYSIADFKIKLNNFGSLFYAESFQYKFPKIFEENSEKKNKKKT